MLLQALLSSSCLLISCSALPTPRLVLGGIGIVPIGHVGVETDILKPAQNLGADIGATVAQITRDAANDMKSDVGTPNLLKTREEIKAPNSLRFALNFGESLRSLFGGSNDQSKNELYPNVGVEIIARDADAASNPPLLETDLLHAFTSAVGTVVGGVQNVAQDSGIANVDLSYPKVRDPDMDPKADYASDESGLLPWTLQALEEEVQDITDSLHAIDEDFVRVKPRGADNSQGSSTASPVELLPAAGSDLIHDLDAFSAVEPAALHEPNALEGEIEFKARDILDSPASVTAGPSSALGAAEEEVNVLGAEAFHDLDALAHGSGNKKRRSLIDPPVVITSPFSLVASLENTLSHD